MTRTLIEILREAIAFYGLCQNCGEIHVDDQRAVEYYNWLSTRGMINFN